MLIFAMVLVLIVGLLIGYFIGCVAAAKGYEKIKVKPKEIIDKVSVAQIKRGDTIVLSTKSCISRSCYERIEQLFEKHFPENSVMILEADVSMKTAF